MLLYCKIYFWNSSGNKTKSVSHKGLGYSFWYYITLPTLQHLKNVSIFISLTWQEHTITNLVFHRISVPFDNQERQWQGICPKFLSSSTIQHIAHNSIVAHFLTPEFRINRRPQLLYHTCSHVSKHLRNPDLYIITLIYKF